MVFDQTWFYLNQSKILSVINGPLSTPARHLLRIDGERSSVGREKIIGITPNAIFWQEDEKIAGEFRTHNKFSKRLYYGLYPVWRTFHAWDDLTNFLRLDYVGLDLNLGFDTLTAYPDPSTGATTVDGHVRRSSVNQTFANIRSGAGVVNSSTTAQENILQLTASTTTDQFAVMRRYYWLFDTSSISSGATISSATFSVYGSAKANGIGSPALDIVTATPASNNTLVNGDYAIANFGTTVHGSVAYANYSTSAYNDITLTTTSVTKAGITKFGGRNSWDTSGTFSGTWVSGDVSSMQAYSADQADITNDPKLVVVFSTGGVKDLIGVGFIPFSR